ncbi:hypothetical protein MNBD_DELTA03-1418 [hydrothermal vent metagenome]|uniref:histidine kinase n=1 Tax=hydrothermal vent metagenome TaxID=652676 RepID=A0A3B0VJV2_9ZZZZ
MKALSINSKIMLVQLLMALLGALALAVAGYFILYTSLTASAKRQMRYVAVSQADFVRHNWDMLLSEIRELGHSEAVTTYTSSFWEGALTEYLKDISSQDFSVVAYLDQSGLEKVKVVNGRKSTHLMELGSSAIFKRARQHPNVIQFEIVTENTAGVELPPPYIEYIYYGDRFGRFTGAVMALSPIDRLSPTMANFHFEETGYLTLMTTDGRVLITPDKGQAMRRVNLGKIIGTSGLCLGGVRIKRAPLLGQDVMNALIYLPEMGVFLDVALPMDRFMLVPRRLIIVYLAIILLTMALCLLVSYKLARGITRPILELAAAANKLAQGDWAQEIRPRKDDETGVLAQAFLVMKGRLHDMIRSRDLEITARRQSEERYRTLFETAPDAISVLDDQGVIVDVNPAALRLYGLGRWEMVGKRTTDFIHPENLEVCQLNFERLKGAAVINVEEEIIIYYGPEREERPVWRKAKSLVDDKGLFRGVLAYDRDLRERREANRLREELDRIARHDLKAPLNGIVNIPYLIRKQNNLSAEQLRWLQMIEDSGYKMLELINNSLEIYRMEEGRYNFQPVRVDCVAILRKIGLDLLDQLQSRRVELRLLVNNHPCRKDERFIISGDELLTYSMLANLIKNALEASPVGQAIEVAMRKAENGRLEIIIHNDGAVPEELRASFFDKYVTWGKRGGSGLGTYSARLMAVTQRGDITMRSSAAQGTFVIIGFGGSAPAD